jgi:hypothetical protein
MEVAGLLMGVPGLVGLLIKLSLQGYEVFSNIRELDEDFRHYHRLFCVEEQRLKDWEKRLAEFTDGRQLEEVLRSENNRYKLIIRIAAAITQLFINIGSMETAYGVRIEEQPASLAWPPTPTLLPTPKGDDQEPGRRKRFSFRRHFRSALSRSPSGARDAISTNKMEVKGTPLVASLSPHPVPLHAVNCDATITEKAKTLAASYDRKISSYQQCKWAVSDKEKFGALVRQLKEYNDGLFDITKPLLSLGMYAPSSSQSYQS